MTTSLLFSPRARRDLRSIWLESAERWGVDQADTYIRDINRHAGAVSKRPGLGRACFELRSGYYRFPAGTHILFYRRLEDGIEIIRILHSRMNVAKHL